MRQKSKGQFQYAKSKKWDVAVKILILSANVDLMCTGIVRHQSKFGEFLCSKTNQEDSDS